VRCYGPVVQGAVQLIGGIAVGALIALVTLLLLSRVG
jgi:uncharacterized membrane protein YccC